MHIVIDARIINSSTGRYVERLLHYLERIDGGLPDELGVYGQYARVGRGLGGGKRLDRAAAGHVGLAGEEKDVEVLPGRKRGSGGKRDGEDRWQREEAQEAEHRDQRPGAHTTPRRVSRTARSSAHLARVSG